MTLPSDVGGRTTQTVGFFACDAPTLATWIREGMDLSWRVRRPRWKGMTNAVKDLAPGGPVTRYACVPIAGWTLVLTNGPDGTDVGVLPSQAARELGVRAMRAVLVEDDQACPARILEVFGPDGEPPLAHERSVVAADDGGRWGSKWPAIRTSSKTCRRTSDPGRRRVSRGPWSMLTCGRLASLWTPSRLGATPG